MKTISLKQGTPEWLAWRSKAIGASDAPVIEGNSPHKTARKLYLEKRGEAPESEGNEFIFAQGHKVEGLIRKEFQDLTGVEMNPICIVHPEFEHIIASLDGFDSKLGVLEAKLVGQDALHNAREGIIPPHHYTQMQHQFACAEVDEGHWFGHDGKKGGVLVPVKADMEYIKRLLEKEHKFWGAVLHGNIPELSADDYLIPDEQADFIALREAKIQADNAKAHFDALKEKVLAQYKHPKIFAGGLDIVQVTTRGPVKYASIPEIAAMTDEQLDKYRGAPSTAWKVSVSKKESK